MRLDDATLEASLNFLIANALNDALTFGLSDSLGGEVIHVSSSIPQEFNLSIANSLTVDVEINGQPGPASPTNYHFYIQFVNNECFFNASSLTLVSPKWSMLAIPSDSYITDIYLISTETITIKPAQVAWVKLNYTSATLSNPEVEMLEVAVTVGENVRALHQKQPVTGTETIHLSTFTDASAPTPLIATLVQPKTVLDDGTIGSLLLRLVNTSSEPVAFARPSQGGDPTPTAMQLVVDLDAAAAWALCKPDEAKLIHVNPPANWTGDPAGVVGTGQKTWRFRPDYSKTKQIASNSAIEFPITGLKTTLPPGFTNLYVTLREFPNYGTQTLVTQIEKSPLIYKPGINSGMVSQGTTGANQALDIKGTTSVELLLAEQSGTGASAHFKGGGGVNIENGLSVSAGTSGQKKVLSAKGGMALGSTFADRALLSADALIVEGAIGIGTDSLKSTLAVKGGAAVGSSYAANKQAPPNTLLVEGAIGIGTDSVKSTLAVNGGAAVGSTYAANNQAPNNTLLVEGAIGIGTPGPKSTLTVKGGATIGSGLADTHSPADGLLVQGNVGIGTNDPKSKLSLNGGGLAIGSYASTTAAPMNGLTVEGNVGIGTPNPKKAKLEVFGNQCTDLGAFSFLAYRDNLKKPYIDNAPPTAVYNGIYSDQRIVGLEFNSFSDVRIKQVIGRSDGVADLATLMQVEVTDFTLKDKLVRDTRPQKKVIGQQLREVYAQAVSVSTEVVPDIYKGAKSSDGWITLDTTLSIGDRVRIIPENDGGSIVEVTEVEPKRFRVSPRLADGQVFVYGREVDDFMHVDYEAIAMLNVSATQQLKLEKDRELETLRDENAALRERLDQLEGLVGKLMS